jgi:hypothetical protein
MPRPFIDSDKPLNHTSRVVLNRKEYDFIVQCAEKEGVSFSQFMRDAVADYLLKKEYRKGVKPRKRIDLPDLL